MQVFTLCNWDKITSPFLTHQKQQQTAIANRTVWTGLSTKPHLYLRQVRTNQFRPVVHAVVSPHLRFSFLKKIDESTETYTKVHEHDGRLKDRM